jgi:hypothetical protein
VTIRYRSPRQFTRGQTAHKRKGRQMTRNGIFAMAKTQPENQTGTVGAAMKAAAEKAETKGAK